jgi:large subunit ribosomal protein L30
MLKITLKRSPIGYNETQKRTVRALGLRKMHQTVQQPDNLSVRGMIHKVRHLVEVETTSEKAVVSRQSAVEKKDKGAGGKKKQEAENAIPKPKTRTPKPKGKEAI